MNTPLTPQNTPLGTCKPLFWSGRLVEMGAWGRFFKHYFRPVR